MSDRQPMVCAWQEESLLLMRAVLTVAAVPSGAVLHIRGLDSLLDKERHMRMQDCSVTSQLDLLASFYMWNILLQLPVVCS